MVRSFKKSVQGEPRTYESVRVGDMYMAPPVPVPVYHVSRSQGWTSMSDPTLIPYWSFTALDRGRAQPYIPFVSPLFQSESGVVHTTSGQGPGNTLMPSDNMIVSGVPNSVLREVRVAKSRTEAKTDVGRFVRSANRIGAFAPGRRRNKEVQTIANFVATNYGPSPKGKSKKRARSSEEGSGRVTKRPRASRASISDTMSAMHLG